MDPSQRRAAWPAKVLVIAMLSSAVVALPMAREGGVQQDDPGGSGRRLGTSSNGGAQVKRGGHSKEAVDSSLGGPRNKPAETVESALSLDRRPEQNEEMRMYLTPCLAKLGEDVRFQMASTEAIKEAGPMKQSDKCAVHSCEDAFHHEKPLTCISPLLPIKPYSRFVLDWRAPTCG